MEKEKRRELMREERAKLSDMTWRQRFGYIWDYYKPAMAAVLAVIVLIVTGIQIYQNKQREILLYVYCLNCSAIDADGKVIAQEFEDAMGGFEKNQCIVVDTSLILDDKGDFQISMASQTKLVAAAENQRLDLMMLPKDVYEEYQTTDSLMPMDEILSEELKEQLQDELVYADGQIYAVMVQDAPYLQEHGIYTGEQELYATVFADAVHPQFCDEFLAFCFQKLSSDQS